MAKNEVWKDMVNHATTLNDLRSKEIKDNKIIDNIHKDKVKILQKIKSNKEDLNKINDLEKKLTAKVNKLTERGRHITADRYKIEQKLLKIKKKELLFQKNVNSAIKAGDGLLGGMLSKAIEIGKELKTPGGVLKVGLMAAMAVLVTFSAQVDKIGEKFGAIGVQSSDIKNDLLSANVEAKKLGMSLDDVVTATTTLTSDFGIGFNEARELSSEVLNLSKAIGVGVDEGAKLVGNFKVLTGLTSQQAINLSKQVTLLSNANDVAPQVVLKDIADSTEIIAGFTDATGENIARAAIQARKLGINISNVAQSARKMLDFESALEASLQAQVLTGKQINIQKIQEASLSGDLEKLQQEQLKQLGSATEFNKMNVLQREALANAVGLELSDATKLVNKQKESTTLAGRLAGQQGFEELVGEEALSNMAQLLFNLKSIGASLVQSLGPALNAVIVPLTVLMKGFAGFIDFINTWIGVWPTVIAGLVAYKGAAIAAAIADKRRSIAAKGGLIASISKSVAQFFEGASLASIASFGLGTPAFVAMAVLAAGALFKGVSKAKNMAEGGIVPAQPGGMLARIGEGGESEAVIPLSKMGDMVGGGSSQAVVSAINSLRSEMIAVKETISQLNLKTSISNNELNIALTPQLTS